MSITEHPDVISSSPPQAEFQARLRLMPDVNEDHQLEDHQLEEVAELAVEALISEAQGLALGPVATIDLDQREIWLEMTVEASSASEMHQKMGLILGALERGAPFVIRESTSSRTETPDDHFVCA